MAKKIKEQGVGPRITVIRKRLRMSQVQFARHIGVPRSTLNNVETGGYPLSKQLAFAIVGNTDLTIDYVYFGNTRFLTRQQEQELLEAQTLPDDF